jgi:hypothetical protein
VPIIQNEGENPMTTKETMNTYRKNAIMAGVLYIAATAATSFTVIIISSMLDAPDYLVRIAANEFQVMMAALLMLIDVVAVVGIGIVLYPILKKHIEALALGYAIARAIEGVLFTVYVIGILSLLTLSQEFVSTLYRLCYRHTITIDLESGIRKSRSAGCFLFSNRRCGITSSI